MKRHSMRSVIVGLVALLGLLACGLQEVRSEEAAKPAVDDFNIESRHVDIWSDGTRLSGDLWYPRGLKSGYKLPAVILCHGWGGVRSHFNQTYASEIAAAGYIVLTFDYRGWGDSDSRLVIKEKMPAPDESGMITVRAQVSIPTVSVFGAPVLAGATSSMWPRWTNASNASSVRFPPWMAVGLLYTTSLLNWPPNAPGERSTPCRKMSIK